MKRVLALVGLLAVGLLLLLEPDSGAVAVIEAATQSTAVTSTSTTAPPDPTPEDTVTTLTETPETTTTVESTTTSTEAPTDASGTFVGEAVNTRFGEFQVQITVDNGVMVDIVTLDEPGDNRSLRINDEAIPIYTEQALELQSADFDAISGATVTWQAWGESLASAVEIAGLT